MNKVVKVLIGVAVVIAADISAQYISKGIEKGARAIKVKVKSKRDQANVEEIAPDSFQEV